MKKQSSTSNLNHNLKESSWWIIPISQSTYMWADHLLKTCQLFPKEVNDHCAENKAGEHSE